ncbi:hypothetical protein M409DRAFT_51694 [Zasmidium cellare ATCC 36951]|uniref:Integral membrane protein n=1 Tax=Zasmidium cellare ATCC 36951 TaxID=1080233 RepID=A0A6A6CTW3_ZASCE|nr:uncharacterized protein M409DRAFT_51694 [Zasmidium cellare ATCC 36951]KAF2170697.1 hypothetical protein M409DRAFT_51694 [Zasmidium cellare ATCC 36951]
MRARSAVLLTSAALLLGALPLVAAHGHEGGDMDMEGPKVTPIDPDSPTAIAHRLESYFRHPHYFGWHLAHTVLMVLAWFIAMPLAIMLSIGRSRYHLPAQVFFHILNGLGVFTAVVYNASTPDLYPNNAHHGLGWATTGFTIAWTIMSFYVAYGEYKSKRRASLEQGRPLTPQRMAEYNQFHDETPPRHSRDSGQGTERNSASLFGHSRQNSSDSVYQKPELPIDDDDFDEDKDQEPEKRGFLGNNRVDRFISKSVRRFSTQRASKVVRFCQIVLEKFLLLLGFAALTTGFIVSGGLFRNRQIFSGLAHYIKGGIFVWYGLLTLGRWMGAFTEFGWAWNVRPQRPVVSKWKSRVPSAEFTESFVIWLYGASNVFLEHLNNWGSEWTASDLEHLSITVLFFGGGLLGMLIESKWVRDLLNTTVEVQKSKEDHLAGASRFAAGGAAEEPHDHDQRWEEPKTYRVPLNPMPGLTIMLLGMMMSAHHQQSMVSTMLHAQWGGLFSAFALARGVTYISLYLKPPTSHFPSRPPSEIVASFCLTAGGILFMNSASDIVWAIESNGLDAMTIFTVSMGLTGIILGWEVVVFAIKGWAMRKERAAAGKPLATS